ncbi:hypothetical protein TL16_g03515 [Triparma laevis f. inornata]|uniref:Myb-like domain-containing protein n=1 Tax=Triparma laevis f. inornata TaxID=1714386 RepID=A0A9W6ZZ79_9STRA|nr:hypothetical protein TL16_g03515 [Triparma laevis f. inornata]
MATVKREKMNSENYLAYVDEIDINIEIKREEGALFGREEEDRRREERTGFEEVKEERCRLCVKASEEKLVLEERVKWAEAKLREAKAELREAEAELRETKMEIVVLREGRDDDRDGGGEEEGIEDEEVVVPAASKPAKPRDRSSGKKRKAAAQVEEQPRNVIKVKTASPKTRTPRPTDWTADEEAALLEAVNEHGLDFDRIKAEYDARLGGRKAKTLYDNFLRRLRGIGS